MAGDWIKMSVGLDCNPKVVKIAMDLDEHELMIVGALHRFWGWADQHLTETNAVSVSKKFINRMVGLQNFAEALESVGWLEGEDGALSFPNFERHNGKTAKKRAQTARRVANLTNANPNATTNANPNADTNAASVRVCVSKNKNKIYKKTPNGVKEKAAAAVKRKKPVVDGGGFHMWTADQFRADVAKVNAGRNQPLPADQLVAFVEYWTAPTKTGHMLFSTMKTWKTSGRLATWYNRAAERGEIRANNQQSKPDLPEAFFS